MIFKPVDIFKFSQEQFTDRALALFQWQAIHCSIYREYLELLGRNPAKINRLEEVPFLPISLFKDYEVYSAKSSPQRIFESSGTTAGASKRSKHLIASLEIYKRSYQQAWDLLVAHKGPLLALLPSYQEQPNSSLIAMVQGLMDSNLTPEAHDHSGFFTDLDKLSSKMDQLEAEAIPFLLIGVSFALLDLAEYRPRPYRMMKLMETGGMKGRREEITREALHDQLSAAFQLEQVYSEYGMTELLSQAYAQKNGRFFTPPWMKVLTREANDPFSYCEIGQTGGLNIIDLANFYSCSFIESGDLGRCHPDGSFEVLGRFDMAEVRGCNLMWNG